MLTDEQSALQLAYISLEEKFRKMQDENNELVTRWMQWKSQQADKLNEENHQAVLRRQQKLQEELKAAAQEKVDIKEYVYVLSSWVGRYFRASGTPVPVNLP